MIRCPSCSSILFRRSVAGIEVDGCPGCGGSFFDGRELEALVTRPGALREIDRHFVPGLQPALDPIRSDACPRCTRVLIRVVSPSLGGAIETGGCPSCGGTWLDHGQPTTIADHFAPDAIRDNHRAPHDSPTASRFSAVLGVAAGVGGRPASGTKLPPFEHPTSTADMPVVRGRRLASAVEEGGFLGGISRALRFFGTAFSLAVEQPILLVPALGGALLKAALLCALLLWGFHLVAYPDAATAAVTQGQLAAAWLAGHALFLPLLLLVLFFAGHLVNLVILGVTVSMIDAYMKGLEPRFDVAVRDVGKNLGAVVTLAAIGSFIELVAAAIRSVGRRQGLASVLLRPLTDGVAGLIEAGWTILGFLLLPVILVEDVGLRAALRRARAIHRGSLLPIAVGEVGIRALGAFTGIGLALFLFLGGFALWPLDLAELRGLLIILIVSSSFASALFAYLRGAYYTCLYLWAAEIERAREPALAVVPAPLAEALAWD